LAKRREHAGFFGCVVETGAHQRTLRMIAAGDVDASAIDSTVLETEVRRRPLLAQSVRVIETWGPSPAPPWVVSLRLSVALRRRLRGIVLAMHREPAGRALLRKARMARFTGISDRDYDPIRRMALGAARADLVAGLPADRPRAARHQRFT